MLKLPKQPATIGRNYPTIINTTTTRLPDCRGNRHDTHDCRIAEEHNAIILSADLQKKDNNRSGLKYNGNRRSRPSYQGNTEITNKKEGNYKPLNRSVPIKEE